MAIEAIEWNEESFEVTARETLTAGDVERIAAALEQRPRGATTTIDLRRVRTCEAPALLMLSRALAERGGEHVLLGLTAADRRLLRYLAPPVTANDPA